MAPTWLPQNVQKRIFRYILNKLSLFSNLDLDNLAVTLGTTSNISLTDVQLDTERLSIPGVSVRDGVIKNLELKLDVMSRNGVVISGSDISIVAAVSPAKLEEEEINELLARTTTDLTESIFYDAKEDNKEEDSGYESEDAGYGMGEFTGVVNKIVDTAISQVKLNLSNLNLKIILDEDITVETRLGSFNFVSKDGKRFVHLGDIQVYKTYDNEDDSDSSDEDYEDESPDYHTMEVSNMMQSTMFSAKESMYLSAMSELERSRMPKIDPPLLFKVSHTEIECDKQFRDFVVNIGDVQVLATNCLSALDSFKVLIESTLSNRNAGADEEVEPELSVEKLHIGMISVINSDSLDEAHNALRIDTREVIFINGKSVVVGECVVYRGDRKVLYFEGENERSRDITVKLSTSTVTLSKGCKVDLNLDDVLDIKALSLALPNILDLFYHAKPKVHFASGPNKSVLKLQTSTLEIAFSTESLRTDLWVSPIKFEDGLLSIDEVQVSGEQGMKVEVKKCAIVFADIPRAIIRHDDSIERSSPVHAKLTIETVTSVIVMGLVQRLLQEVSLAMTSREVDTSGRQFSSFSSDPQEFVSLSMVIRKLSSQLVFSNRLGTIDLDFGGVITNLLNSRSIQTTIDTVFVTRDFGDLDPKVGMTSLIQYANPQRKDRPMVYFAITSSKVSEVRLCNTKFDYHIRLLKLFEEEASTEHHVNIESPGVTIGDGLQASNSTIHNNDLRCPIFIDDCAVGLEPYQLPSRGVAVIREATAELKVTPGKEAILDLLICQAGLVLVDDVNILELTGKESHLGRDKRFAGPENTSLLGVYLRQGYVGVGNVPNMTCKLVIAPGDQMSLNISSESILLETCADSTQTLIQLINGLKPPVEASTERKYHTEVLPVDVFKDVDDTAFMEKTMNLSEFDSNSSSVASQSHNEGNAASIIGRSFGGISRLDFIDSYVDRNSKSRWTNSSSINSLETSEYSQADSLLDKDLSTLAKNKMCLEASNSSKSTNKSLHDISITEEHFSNSIHGGDTDDDAIEEIQSVPFKVDLKDSKVVWNLHDGYDWSYTRDVLNRAVHEVEREAGEIHKSRARPNDRVLPGQQSKTEVQSPEGADEEVEEVVGDYLFNSIYIGIPTNQDVGDLRRAIKRDIYDESDTTSINTYNTISRSSSKSRFPELSRKRTLNLRRSKQHKVQFVLDGLSLHMSICGNVNDLSSNIDGQLLSHLDLRIRDLEIFDNVPTSTWNKFLSYMRTAGERETNSNMIRVSMDMVRPFPGVAVSEAVIKVFVLPLRLHVDQDTLDFITRFFEFKDERAVIDDTIQEELFIQKCDVNEVKVKLDYKPKKVDYIGLKSGHTTEFMNFFILEEADIILKGVTVYGVNGLPRLAAVLNSTWMPDIRTTQLADVLAGIAPVKSLVKLGNSIKKLVVIPVREYRKDGRLVRGIQQGAWDFARTTTSELVKLGARVAAGSQALLESAEQAMGGSGASARSSSSRRRYISPYSDNPEDYEVEDDEEISNVDISVIQEEERRKLVSLYANQPQGFQEGINRAYQSLGRNFNIARQAVADLGNEAAETGTAKGVAVAVARAAPVAIIRPVIGATEAVSKTLLGVTNQIDPEQIQEVQDKYKHTGNSPRASPDS